MRPSDRRPIGVFDSGVGGLTVLKALRARLPGESTLYLGDTARVPYGTKSPEVVTRYSLKNAEFLMKHDIKMLVVACNTASSVALPALSAALGIPVLGVIEPGARAAAKQTRSGRVGVIGTQGTIASGAYQRALTALNPGVQVLSVACPLFVPLAEEGWLTGEIPRRVAEAYLQGLAAEGVDTLVLGCTHYPLLSAAISQVMGPTVTLVDSAEATAEVAVGELRRQELLAPEGQSPVHRAFVTDTPAAFLKVAARFLGEPLADAEQVDLTF